ncbi:hypothetical protein DFJ73DRAFT_808884 [Zopfochytrium polystomum]|nr:hypothetical protein DFJ73DRAFT_808884 [Zopfochytrium polystomum]
MYGRVVNKHARWNLCFDAVAQEPDYEAGKGRIVAMRDVPLLQQLHAAVEGLLPPKTAGMKVESNYYYDAAKCGIGFHGDTERKRVVGARLGTAAMPIYFRWFHNGRAVGEKVEIPLYPGDLYVMSEKAAGSDWRSSSKYTLRHAVGKNFAK